MTEAVKIIPPNEAPEKAAGSRGRPATWPYDDLEVGGAFEFPADLLQSMRTRTSQKNATQKGSENPKRWSCGEGADGKFYVWRHQ